MKAERFVIDTNVLISAAFSVKTSPGLVVRHVLAHAHIVFAEATFAELNTRLWRPKFDRYLSIESRKQLLHDFRAEPSRAEPSQGVAVLPTALMKAEIDSGLIRVLPTKMPLASGTMVVAHSGPAHRYRLLNRMIIKALNESGLMEPL